MKCLQTALQTVNERSRGGGCCSGGSAAPQDCSSNSAAGADQGGLAETRPGKMGEYSPACSGGPGARANRHMDMALGNKSPLHALVALVTPWGQGVERNLQIIPWVIRYLCAGRPPLPATVLLAD